MRITALACLLLLAPLSGCAQARRCRDARREARWAAHAYLESIRSAVQALVGERDALKGAVEGSEPAIAIDAEDPAAELARRERALEVWRARLEAVRQAHGSLRGDGPVEGDPREPFAAREDDPNPAGAEAARRAVQHAIDVCGRAR